MATYYLLIDASTDVPYWDVGTADHILSAVKSTDVLSWEFPPPSLSTYGWFTIDSDTDVPAWLT